MIISLCDEFRISRCSCNGRSGGAGEEFPRMVYSGTVVQLSRSQYLHADVHAGRLRSLPKNMASMRATPAVRLTAQRGVALHGSHQFRRSRLERFSTIVDNVPLVETGCHGAPSCQARIAATMLIRAKIQLTVVIKYDAVGRCDKISNDTSCPQKATRYLYPGLSPHFLRLPRCTRR